MRKKMIAGNWKMHKTIAEAQTLSRMLADRLRDVNFADIAIMPPYVDLYPVSLILREKESKILLGAQNLHPEPKGAFTGEITAEMLLSAGAKLVIIGHSERRHVFGEQNDYINRKVIRALDAGLKPVLCIGELLEQRKDGKMEEVLLEQLRESLKDVSIDNADDLIIAYEPVWAIGTGVNATPEQAQDAHVFVRSILADIFGDTAQEMRILYGGSVKPANAASLMSQPDVDGALVGGASLDTDTFEGIIRANW